MGKIIFTKKAKRDTPLTVRLTSETIKKLKKISQSNGVSQTHVIERLIEAAYDQSSVSRRNK